MALTTSPTPPKKDSSLQLINLATRINKVTIRDARLPPSSNKFVEDFGNCYILLLLDFFLEYNQVSLDIRNQDISTFISLLVPLGIYILPQEATNLVA